MTTLENGDDGEDAGGETENEMANDEREVRREHGMGSSDGTNESKIGGQGQASYRKKDTMKYAPNEGDQPIHGQDTAKYV